MSFQVKLQPSGRRFGVESGESVLAAALRQGLVLPYGCRSGACGTCQATLQSGSVHYADGLPRALAATETPADRILLCQAQPASDLVIAAREIRAPGDIEIKNLPAKVSALEPLTHDVMRLRLTLPPNERLQFLAGQYLEILLKDGRRRGFSIANAPHDDGYIELHVRLIPGGHFTRYVFEEMKPKSMLRIEGPLGSYYLREDSPRPVILVGGGTGFAPLKGMLEHAFHNGFDRPLHLFWGVRSGRDLYFQDEIGNWLAQHSNFRYTPVLSEPAADDCWSGATGLVTDAVVREYPDLSGHDLYLSGPPAMVEAARGLFGLRGLPADQMFSDAFEFALDTRNQAAGSA